MVEFSEDKIDEIVNLILILNIIATIANVFIFFVMFKPYFINEEKYLKNRSLMFEIAFKTLYNV